MDNGRDAHRVKSLSRHTLEQMVARSSEGILLADAQDPKLPIVYANPAYEALTGYTVEELAGNSWPLVKRDVEGQPELERLKAAIGRSEPCEVTLPDLRKDGTSWHSPCERRAVVQRARRAQVLPLHSEARRSRRG